MSDSRLAEMHVHTQPNTFIQMEIVRNSVLIVALFFIGFFPAYVAVVLAAMLMDNSEW